MKYASIPESPPPQLPPLTSAVVVVGQPYECEENGVPPEIAALPHVAALVSDFLDQSRSQSWSISRACAGNYMSLLPRLAVRADQVALSIGEDGKAAEAGKGLMAAVQHGNVEMAKWLHAYCPRVDTRFALREVARAGKLALLEWIADNFERVALGFDVASSAALGGQLETLQWIWLDPRSPSFSDLDVVRLIECAVLDGHLAVVTWLNKQQQWDVGEASRDRFRRALRLAVRRKHLEIVKYLAQFGMSWWTFSYLKSDIMKTRDTEMIEWVMKRRWRF